MALSYNIWFGTIMLLFFITSETLAGNCNIENYADCTYVVRCIKYAGSANNVNCNGAPNVTFIIQDSTLEHLSQGFFSSTNFDARVRTILSIGNFWKNIDIHAFSYFTKTLHCDLSKSEIQKINDQAFQNLIDLKILNISHNFISTLTTKTFYITDSKEPALKILDLSYNYITEIKENFLKPLPRLETLYLNNNVISSLSDDSFTGARSLTSLNLEKNSLTHFNLSLVGLKNLTTLNVSFNFLTYLSGYEINRLNSLIFFNVSNNQIKSVESNCFNQAFNIVSLDFSNNLINISIEAVMFINNANLKYLNFYNNSIYHIEENAFQHNNLEYLNMELNNITGEIKEKTFNGLNNLNSLDLSNEFVSKIYNGAFSHKSGLLKLNLSNNVISEIEDSSFQDSALRVLDLAKNNLKSIKFLSNSLNNLTDLYLGKNKLTIISQNTFAEQVNLITLDLSDNVIVTIEAFSLPLNKLQYLNMNGNSLTGALMKNVVSPATYLRYLDLSKHKLRSIDSEAIINMPVLSTLNLSNNNIDRIDLNNFKGLNNLISLDLSHNNISQFNLISNDLKKLQGLFLSHNTITNLGISNMSDIEYLDLSYNNLSDVLNVDFNNLTNLKVLKLSHNNFYEFNNNITNNLTNLVSLYLSSNKLRRLNLSQFKDLMIVDGSHNNINLNDSHFFDNLAKLKYLDLSGNNITNIAPGTFKSTENLLLLNLSSNQIYYFRYGMFKGLQNIRIFDVSKNKITELDADVFHECANLTNLIIDYNYIKSINIEHLKKAVPLLKTVSLGGNPVSCKEIVKNIKMPEMKVTSLEKVYHADNVYGIQCGDTLSQYNSSNHYNGSEIKGYSMTTSFHIGFYVWSTIITVILLIIIVAMFYKRHYLYTLIRESRSIPNNSLELGSDY